MVNSGGKGNFTLLCRGAHRGTPAERFSRKPFGGGASILLVFYHDPTSWASGLPPLLTA